MFIGNSGGRHVKEAYRSKGEVSRDENTEPDYIGMMRETMEERYSKPRKGWHVTDIALCPRQRVFKKIDPLPITNKELNMFSSGRGIHEAVQ
jgi:hypothetical protein